MNSEDLQQAVAMQLVVLTSPKSSINPITNPNLLYTNKCCINMVAMQSYQEGVREVPVNKGTLRVCGVNEV
jgi:hypothetical protein